MTVGLPPSITATQELVVPKSIPTTFAIRVFRVRLTTILIEQGRMKLELSKSSISSFGELEYD
jgi:hypothetical protein